MGLARRLYTKRSLLVLNGFEINSETTNQIKCEQIRSKAFLILRRPFSGNEYDDDGYNQKQNHELSIWKIHVLNESIIGPLLEKGNTRRQ